MRLSQPVLVFSFLVLAPACGGSPPPAAEVASAQTATPAASTPPAPAATTSEPAAPAPTAQSAPAPETPAQAPSGAPTIPVVAFKIIGTGKMKGVLYELRGDGTLLDKAGKTVGRIDGRSIVFDGADKPVWAVDEGGNVTGSVADTLGVTRARFDEKNALVLSAGDARMVVAVDPTGKIRMSRGAKTDSPPCRIDGMTPAANRAVELLVMTIAWPK